MSPVIRVLTFITHKNSLSQLNYYGSIPSVTKNLNNEEGRSFVLIASTKCNQEMPVAEPSMHWS